jgi:thiol-disulfide isomerase/thioredoxin
MRFRFLIGLVLSTSAVLADDVPVEFISEGVTEKMGGYRPIRSEMDQEATIVEKAPKNLKSPRFGWIKQGDLQWAYVLDETEEGEQSLIVDTNRDGDLTNDEPAAWSPKTTGEFTMYSGDAWIDLSKKDRAKIKLYRFDPKDEKRAATKNTILYYGDYGFELRLQLDGKEFSTLVDSIPNEKSRLSIDRDGNGVKSSRYESIRVGKPFNFTGTTYIMNVVDGKPTLNKADESIPQLPLPPDLKLGKPSLAFEGTTMSGDAIKFPESYRGKIVMLDFWATWCGPCIKEIPHMKVAYSEWGGKGFEILGINIDDAGKEEQVAAFLEKNEMPWPQIYGGKGWDSEISVQHDVGGIPFVLLVDCDSGKIIGTSKNLRGEGLAEYIGEQLKLKSEDVGTK